MFEQWTADRLNDIRYRDFPIPPRSDRAFWTSLDKRYTDALIAEANEDVTREFPMILATDYLEFSRSGDRKCMETKYHLRRDALGRLVVAACVTDDDRYYDTIINLLYMISEETFWGVSAHFAVGSEDKLLPHPDIEYVDLFAAETACQVALTLHVLNEGLCARVPGLVDEMYKQIDRRVLSPYEKHEDWWWQGYYRKVNNWNPWITSNVISAAALIPLDRERRAGIYRKCLITMSNFLRDYPADGGCDEGPNYWGRAGGALFEALELLYILSDGRIDFFGEDLIKNIARYMTATHVSGRYFLNYADCGITVSSYAAIIYRYGQMIHDRNVIALGVSLFGVNNDMCRPRSLRTMLMDMATVKYITNDDSELTVPLDSVLPDLQLASFREKNIENAGLCISVKGGNNAESHNHNDVGSIIAYLNGSPVIIDTGCGTYTRQTFSDERYTIWTMQSSWHNLPDINGTAEINGKEHSALFFDVTTGKTSTATTEISKAYDSGAGLSSMTRTVSLDRESGTASVIDTFGFTNGNNSVAEHLMFCRKPTIAGNTVSVKALNGDCLNVRFDGAARLHAEEKKLTDPALLRAWGVDSLWRVTSAYDAEGKELTTHFEIKAE
ncbi:MAG: heparinase II/III-family protein [Clostridia bacterium]|nr:heparinase II/III-family protein [Clostridia bacterium]